MTIPYQTPEAAENTLRDRIAGRAHDLWDEAGRPDGRSNELWNEARAEIRVEMKAEIDYSDPLTTEGFSR